MINLLAYINPLHKFDDEHSVLVKIQIDNSLDLGWKKEDILLATNFDYEYNSVKSFVVDDKNLILFDLRMGKISAINYLFAKGLIKENELYWFHDFDALQLYPISEDELGIKNLDLGLTNNGPAAFNAGSFFFNSKTKDIFSWVENFIRERNLSEEVALASLAESNGLNIMTRYKLLGSTYNLGVKNFAANYAKAVKPIKVAHFHPLEEKPINLYRDFLPNRFLKVLNKYGFG